jgi:hypothetical protein
MSCLATHVVGFFSNKVSIRSTVHDTECAVDGRFVGRCGSTAVRTHGLYMSRLGDGQSCRLVDNEMATLPSMPIGCEDLSAGASIRARATIWSRNEDGTDAY